jgi:hypothetical protein
MSSAVAIRAHLIRANVEAEIPAAFAPRVRPEHKSILTGIEQVDAISGGIPIGGLTELCGSNLASSSKASVVTSLVATASQKHFCALVDSSDGFDPSSAEAAGVNFSRLLWVRCGKNKSKLKPLEQAFKTADMLLQSSGFGLVIVDISSIAERFARNVPLTTWFRFRRIIEKQDTALVFIEQQAHATSCASLVLDLKTRPAALSGKLFKEFEIEGQLLRTRDKKPIQNASHNFRLRAEWA